MMYDIQLLELLSIGAIDRVVLQRAPCVTKDLCSGRGTFHSFYRGYFQTAFSQSLLKRVSLFMRFNGSESYWTSILENENNLIIYPFQRIPVRSVTCFETVIIRKCTKCFKSSISSRTVIRFKSKAYSLAGLDEHSVESVKHTIKWGNFSVLIFHRGLHYRDMNNPAKLRLFLLNHFHTNISVRVHYFDPQSATPEGQIRLVATSDVIIATHGAFESNIIYMKNNALFIELLGVYDASRQESINYENLASLFRVNHRQVRVQSLKAHRQLGYVLDSQSFTIIANIIQSFTAAIKKLH